MTEYVFDIVGLVLGWGTLAALVVALAGAVITGVRQSSRDRY